MFKLADGKPIKLYDYQRRWVNDECLFRIVNKSRQTGFSFVCALEALTKAMFVPRSLILFVSTSEKGAQRLMKYVTDAWYSIPDEIKKAFNLESFSKEEISFKHNGSRIVSLANNAATVRGYPATDIYLDEFAFFEHEDKMWEAILPSIVRKELRRRVSIISTPNGKLNNFYKIYVDQKEKPDDIWSRHLVPHTMCPDIDVGKLRLSMDDTQFSQEFCCEFIDTSTAVIPLELIDKCCKLEIPGYDLGTVQKMDRDRITYIGIDFGKKVDSTVASYFEKLYIQGEEEPYLIQRRMDILKGDYTTQLETIKSGLENMHATQAWVDQTGVGEKLVEDVRGYKGCHVNGIIFTRELKERMVTDLLLLMQSGHIKLIDDPELRRQLHTLRRIITDSNNIKFQHEAGQHDDIFWSVALATSKMAHSKGFFGMSTARIKN